MLSLIWGKNDNSVLPDSIFTDCLEALIKRKDQFLKLKEFSQLSETSVNLIHDSLSRINLKEVTGEKSRQILQEINLISSTYQFIQMFDNSQKGACSVDESSGSSRDEAQPVRDQSIDRLEQVHSLDTSEENFRSAQENDRYDPQHLMKVLSRESRTAENSEKSTSRSAEGYSQDGKTTFEDMLRCIQLGRAYSQRKDDPRETDRMLLGLEPQENITQNTYLDTQRNLIGFSMDLSDEATNSMVVDDNSNSIESSVEDFSQMQTRLEEDVQSSKRDIIEFLHTPNVNKTDPYTKYFRYFYGHSVSIRGRFRG